MKKIVLLFLIVLFTVLLHAQEKKCNTPLPDNKFFQKYTEIKNSSDKNKIKLALEAAKTYCFSSKQVKEIASLLDNDYDRLSFAKLAFKNTVDKRNYYDVYDAFIYYSAVFRLHDYINKEKKSTSNISENLPNHNHNLNFPEYNYPEHSGYNGNKNCTNIINKNQFIEITQKINNVKNENEKYRNSLYLIKSKCFSTSQLMKIASLLPENFRLNFAKKAIYSVYDLDNYIEMKQVFNTPRNRNEFMNFLGSQNHSANFENCKILSQEYKEILSTIQKEKYNTTKLNTAKIIIKTKKCFTPLQVKNIIELFDYENSKLEIAKLGYDFTLNRDEYYKVISNALGFENSKKRLLDYIQSKQK